MDILFDIHTHTRYSDGKSSVAENVAAARKRGLTVGISDHGPGHPWYGVGKRDLLHSASEIAALTAAEADGRSLQVLQGIEANLMSESGETDIPGDPVLDYYLLGYHKGIFPKSGFSLSMKLLEARDSEAARRRMTDAMIAALADGRIDVITHPGTYIPVEMARLAEAATAQGVLLELNQRHPMSAADARAALAAGAHFLVSSDAHKSELIGVVDRPLSVAAEANIPPERIFNNPEYIWAGRFRLERLKDRLTGGL